MRRVLTVKDGNRAPKKQKERSKNDGGKEDGGGLNGASRYPVSGMYRGDRNKR